MHARGAQQLSEGILKDYNIFLIMQNVFLNFFLIFCKNKISNLQSILKLLDDNLVFTVYSCDLG